MQDEIRYIIFEHIRQNAREKGIHLDCINGYVEHAHCLVSLNGDQSISNLMQLIKGESSHWINKQNLCSPKFEWQTEYFVESVSPRDLEKVRAYIHGQEAHHRKISFHEEYAELIKRG
jgi:REP element-mobilizing transposase RayT